MRKAWGKIGLVSVDPCSFQVDPSRVEPVDCSKEGPADWTPYEDFEQQLVYLPNGTAVPSTKHQHAYGDWQYVLRLKAG